MEKAPLTFGWIGFGLIPCERHLPDSNESHQQCDELFADLHLRSLVSLTSRIAVFSSGERFGSRDQFERVTPTVVDVDHS